MFGEQGNEQSFQINSSSSTSKYVTRLMGKGDVGSAGHSSGLLDVGGDVDLVGQLGHVDLEAVLHVV